MHANGRVSVLLVGESARIPEIQRILERRTEIRLTTVGPGEQALNQAQREQPGLIIIGVEPAEPSGLELCAEFKSLPVSNDIPVILVTQPKLRRQAEKSGADAVLYEPFLQRELLQHLGRYIPLRERRHSRYPINLRFTFFSDQGVGQAFSRVISCGGAFLKTDRRVPLGAQIELCFRLPGDPREIRCKGVVRSALHWFHDSDHMPGFGLEFEDLSAADRRRLNAFLERPGRGRAAAR